MKIQKTNAMRILDSNRLSYEVLSYAHGTEPIAGLAVAKQLLEDPEQVFKTLVTVANTKEYIVFVIPVAYELHLKKCAKAAGVKSVEMIHVKDINKLTGYVRGGCSPIGMKKQFRTFVHESCTRLPAMMFSGGKIGVQIKMQPDDLLKLIRAETADIICDA
ncbi:Cys-tRNA(Pro) deacylase [[Clostridium] innocuum]|nr:Cys-tRNA(Pro) deacylase [Erysipelotrichaceae bacterium]MCR0382418.1 Cys-tRNA(Pro) deacylase [[Clostridium] innocuum]MCR0411765.1 Cys-tRNA(Pro) deacylase [[Clostridium] innocuum]MCR0533062.1 Cys-tRNA(Pro) deacylase [[Clostridium] innocuum]MCR0538067.1 Cys-tRNA(Pro) deacylase [[Clostridium] innocuum]